ncbi:MAG TPA: hypothetical protein VGG64_05980 [Pirellulales bacterium]|jgi:hypothetical protein
MAFSDEQTMLTLAFISDLGETITGTDCGTEVQLCQNVRQHLASEPAVAGDWDLVWGPTVFKFPLIARHTDDVFYIAQNTSDRSRYVLALSSTNPYELTDWLFEDFMVLNTTAWTYGVPPPGARISNSDALSLAILLGVKPCYGIPGAGQTLMDFLTKTVAASGGNVEVTVTGHSLGGALAATAALLLADTQGPNVIGPNRWDPTNKAAVRAFCYAGPATGNSAWADYFDQRLGANTRRIWNSLDVVPRVWNVHDMTAINSIYEPSIKTPFWTKTLVRLVSAAVADDCYEQIQKKVLPLVGSVNVAMNTFIEQVIYQHIDAYFVLLGLPVPMVLLNKLRAAAR